MDNGEISRLRRELDLLDDAIVALLLKRVQLAENIIKEKYEHNLPIEDASREKEILLRLQEQLPPEYKELIEKLYPLLFSLVKRG